MGKRKNKELQKVEQVRVDGNVILKVKVGNKTLKTIVTHNTATLNLFYGLILALTNASQNSIFNYLPNYICAGTGTTSNVSDVELTGLINPINMIMPTISKINSPIRQSDKVVITFQAVIPYMSIGSTTEIKELGLYGNRSIQSNTMVARIQLTDDQYITLEKGQSLYIQ